MYLHREDRDQGVAHLAQTYPKCFFEDPDLRRPLKHGIIDDLEGERVLDHGKLIQILDWYQSHFVYQRGLIAGAERIDLNGKKAGTVTPKEQQDARTQIARRKKEMAEQRALQSIDPAPPIVRPPPDRELNGAPHMISKTPPPPGPHPAIETIKEIQTALATAATLMTEKQFELLRPVLVTAALKEVIGGTEQLLKTLQTPQVT